MTGCPERLVLPGESPDTDKEVDTSCHDALPCLYQHADDIDVADDFSTVAAATCTLNAVVSVVTWDMVREATTSLSTYYRADFQTTVENYQQHCDLIIGLQQA